MRWLVLALLAACGHPPSKPPDTAAPRDTKACATDDDCTLVEACCGCARGGKRIALRKDAVAAHEARRAEVCAGSTCKDAELPHSSCDAEAVCRAGQCQVQAHLGGS
jgi:hypothetical protein